MAVELKPSLIRSILFATDGSAPAERAANLAASLALGCQARVTILHVFAPIPGDLGEPNFSNIIQQRLDESRALVEATAARLRALGVREVDTDTVGGTPAERILAVAEIRQPDLIVMGARGLSTLQSILLGSTSLAVMQHAECPVVVVK